MSRLTSPTTGPRGAGGGGGGGLRAEQTALLAGDGQEQHRAPWPLARGGQQPCRLEQQRAAHGVVVVAVVDLVPLERRALAEVVEVGADDDHLAPQRRVAARQQ